MELNLAFPPKIEITEIHHEQLYGLVMFLFHTNCSMKTDRTRIKNGKSTIPTNKLWGISREATSINIIDKLEDFFRCWYFTKL